MSAITVRVDHGQSAIAVGFDDSGSTVALDASGTSARADVPAFDVSEKLFHRNSLHMTGIGQ